MYRGRSGCVFDRRVCDRAARLPVVLNVMRHHWRNRCEIPPAQSYRERLIIPENVDGALSFKYKESLFGLVRVSRYPVPGRYGLNRHRECSRGQCFRVVMVNGAGRPDVPALAPRILRVQLSLATEHVPVFSPVIITRNTSSHILIE